MKQFLTTARAMKGIALVICTICFLAFAGTDNADNVAAIGTRTILQQATADTVTSSTTTIATELTTPIAANQKLHIRYYVPITLGGTAPGIKFLVNAPSGVSIYKSGAVIYADDSTIALVSQISSEAAQGVTLANAGNHIAIIDVSIVNGSTAGDVVLEFAQNVSDAAATIVQAGAVADITKF
jgi:hypothetical protein